MKTKHEFIVAFASEHSPSDVDHIIPGKRDAGLVFPTLVEAQEAIDHMFPTTDVLYVYEREVRSYYTRHTYTTTRAFTEERDISDQG